MGTSGHRIPLPHGDPFPRGLAMRGAWKELSPKEKLQYVYIPLAIAILAFTHS